MLTIAIYGIKDVASANYPCHVHDHSITFMRNGRIVSTITLERYTGVKHDQRLSKFITTILEKWVDSDEPVRFVLVNSFMGNSFISDDETFSIEPLEEPTIANILTPARVKWYRNNKSNIYQGWIMCHEFAHLAAALPFGVRFNEQQLLVHIDGGASQSACSFWQVKKGTPELLHSSWDDLKDPVNNFNVGLLGKTLLGLNEYEHLSMPGKLMGFAAYGKADLSWQQYLKQKRFYLDTKWKKETMQQDLFHYAGRPFDVTDLHCPLTQTLATCIQKEFETNIIKTIRNFKNISKAKQLIYAGGAALNIPTNTMLEYEFGFGNVFIPPCAEDSGLSIGAAAWIEHINGNKIAIHDPFLNCFDISTEKPILDTIADVAKLIADNKIIALCLEGSEVGPRALGHRSIIARPDNIDLKTCISEQIKQREWYRPIAPALLADVASQALCEPVESSRISPFMLGNYTVHDDWREKFIGVTHVDGTMRVQIVKDSIENKYLYMLLQVLKNEHDIPGVINTSFNLQGKPIVHSHDQAISIGESTPNIDMVVVNGSLHYT